jgi:hypothetical protein
MDGKTNAGTGTDSPQAVAEYRIATGAGPWTADTTTSLARDWGGIALAFAKADRTWADSPNTVDGNAATYGATTIADDFWRVDATAAYVVTSARALIGFSSSASRTVVLQGATDLAFTSPVTLASRTLTSTGSYTGDEFAFTIASPAAYRYYRLVASGAYDARTYSVELIEARNLAGHVIAADPHTGYQKESEKDVASGYAGLDSASRVSLASLAALSWKHYCRAATTADITISTALNSGDTLDGVTLADGDRVLVKDQSAGAENGIYVVGASPARAADMSAADEFLGAATMIIAGTVNAGRLYYVSSPVVAPTVGTTAVVWSRLGGAASLTVEEVDGSPTDASITKIIFPNDTVSIAAGVATVASAPARAFIGCSLINSGVQAIGSGAAAQLTFDTEEWDSDGFHSTSSNTQRVTIPAGMSGKYLIRASTYSSGMTADGYYYIGIKKNGAAEAFVRTSKVARGTSNVDNAEIVVVVDAVAGDYYEVSVNNGDSSSRDFGHASADRARSRFQIVKLDSGKAGGAIGAAAFNSAVQSVPTATLTALTLNSEDWDSDGFHSTSSNTSRMTIPAGLGGAYLLIGSSFSAAGDAVGEIAMVRFLKNGATELGGESRHLGNTAAASAAPVAVAVAVLVPGDYVELIGYHTVGASTDFGHATSKSVQTRLQLVRLDSGSGNVAVVASYCSTAGQNMVTGAALAIVNYGTLITDTHSAVTTGASWKFTAPIAGNYQINTMISWPAAASWADGERGLLQVFKNGTAYRSLDRKDNNPAGSLVYMQGSTVVPLNAGDYIDIRLTQNSGSDIALSTSATDVWVDVVKVG